MEFEWVRHAPSAVAYRYEMALGNGLNAFFLVRQDGQSPHLILYLHDASLVVDIPGGTNEKELLVMATDAVKKVLSSFLDQLMEEAGQLHDKMSATVRALRRINE